MTSITTNRITAMPDVELKICIGLVCVTESPLLKVGVKNGHDVLIDSFHTNCISPFETRGIAHEFKVHNFPTVS